MINEGLYNKYIVRKADGSDVDPKALYFILRVDAGEYVTACRAGLAVFAKEVARKNPCLAIDIQKMLAQYNLEKEEQ